jgi:phage terminase large subunit-like protein
MNIQATEAKYSANWLALQTPTLQKKFLASLTDREVEYLQYDWQFWARPKQKAPPGDWVYWLIMAGRGFGKTRAGAEWIREEVERRGAIRVALVGATAGDVRDIMIEGESGILNIYPPGQAPIYEPSKRRLTWINGARATTYTAEKPERLKGPQHHIAWCDEPASWFHTSRQATWDMLQFGLRLGDNPRAVLTTTPKPVKFIREFVKDPLCAVTTGTTYENRANLAPSFFDKIIRKYEGTRLGQQEIYARLLDDVPDALWRRALIDQNRVNVAPEYDRVVVAIDPATTKKRTSDETGIVTCGKAGEWGYVITDKSFRGSPIEWAQTAILLYFDFEASALVVEDNQGGDMTQTTIEQVAIGLENDGIIPTRNINIKRVTARRSKGARAEPISALYEQGKIKHVGAFDELEDQMCTWVPGDPDSPDRLDALVWALNELMIKKASGWV